MRRRLATAAFACAVTALTLPALAVDRSLGAGVPKPSASGMPWTDAEVAALNANVAVALAGAPTLRGAHVGIAAIDARDGRVLFERNADDALQPASTFKLLVGSAALDRLGTGFRFRTQVVANGPISGGVLQGALILRGGGDPFLNAADLDAAADAVAKAGITRIAGGVVIDDRHLERAGYLPGWSWDDFPFYYAPVVSGVTFEENVVHLTVTPGAAAGDRAVVRAAPAGIVGSPVEGCRPTVDVRIVPEARTGDAGTKETIDVNRDAAGCIHVTGAIPLGAKPATVDAAVVSPAAYAYTALNAALVRHGVASVQLQTIAGPWPSADEHRVVPVPDPGATIVWSHDSQPLSDTLADLWLPSDNLVAELLLRELGVAADGTPGTTAHGVAVEKSWLKSIGVDPEAGITIEDGSGLSTYDRITPHALVAILKHDWDGPNRELVLDDLPIAGVRGTLTSSYLGTPAEKRVFAKTGSLSHVSTLAGYVATAKHGTVIFDFAVDDWVGESAALRDVRGRVLALFAGS